MAYFTGSVEEAVLQAGRANSKAKQPMTNTERQDFAWRLVRLGSYTRNQVAEAAGVSLRQVATMREVLKELGEDAFAPSIRPSPPPMGESRHSARSEAR